MLARVERIRALLGADVDRDEMIAGLERLGLSVERSMGALDVLVPSFRPDLVIEDDIAEEVGRIALGYENLPETLPPARGVGGADSPLGRWTDRVREALVRAGLQEARTHSLAAPSPLATPDEAARRVSIRSALSPELSSLRTSLLPNLLEIAARADHAGLHDIALFEVGPVYQKSENGGYAEPLRIAGVLAGSAVGGAWGVRPDLLVHDFFYAKGVVNDLLADLDINAVAFAPGEHPITHPGRTAIVSARGENIGLIAELSESVVTGRDLPRRTCVFELDGDALLRLSHREASAGSAAPPRFPAVTRDLAPVLSKSVPYARIQATAVGTAGPLLESLRLIDVYEGAGLGPERRSLTLRFTFRSAERTLRDEEAETALTHVRTALRDELGAELRG